MDVGSPRRTDKSLADEKYNEYLKSLEGIVPQRREEPLLPVVQAQNTARRQNEGYDEGRQEGERKSYKHAVMRRKEREGQKRKDQEVTEEVESDREGEVDSMVIEKTNDSKEIADMK